MVSLYAALLKKELFIMANLLDVPVIYLIMLLGFIRYLPGIKWWTPSHCENGYLAFSEFVNPEVENILQRDKTLAKITRFIKRDMIIVARVFDNQLLVNGYRITYDHKQDCFWPLSSLKGQGLYGIVHTKEGYRSIRGYTAKMKRFDENETPKMAGFHEYDTVFSYTKDLTPRQEAFLTEQLNKVPGQYQRRPYKELLAG